MNFEGEGLKKNQERGVEHNELTPKQRIGHLLQKLKSEGVPQEIRRGIEKEGLGWPEDVFNRVNNGNIDEKFVEDIKKEGKYPALLRFLNHETSPIGY